MDFRHDEQDVEVLASSASPEAGEEGRGLFVRRFSFSVFEDETDFGRLFCQTSLYESTEANLASVLEFLDIGIQGKCSRIVSINVGLSLLWECTVLLEVN